MLPATWRGVRDLGGLIRRLSCPRTPFIRLKPTGEALHPNWGLFSAHVCTPEPMRSTNTRLLTRGTLDIDSVITAETRMSARAEEVRQLVQRPIRDAWGGGVSHSPTPAKIAINSALTSLTDPRSLRKEQ